MITKGSAELDYKGCYALNYIKNLLVEGSDFRGVYQYQWF